MRQRIANPVRNVVRCGKADTEIETGFLDICAVLINLLVEHSCGAAQIAAKQIGLANAKADIGAAAGRANRRVKSASRAKEVPLNNTNIETCLIQ